MSSIQRYRVYDEDEVLPFDNGEYVTYADHVAAVQESQAWHYKRGASDERARIKAAVVASAHACDMTPEDMAWRYDALLAIIDGEDK